MLTETQLSTAATAFCRDCGLFDCIYCYECHFERCITCKDCKVCSAVCNCRIKEECLRDLDVWANGFKDYVLGINPEGL